MSEFLSRIKARLEPGQQFVSQETGWVRAAVEAMEKEGTEELHELVQRLEGVTLDSSDGQVSEKGGDCDFLSPHTAFRRLWGSGSLEAPLPDGFCLRVAHEEALLVDAERDKRLVRLKELCADIVKGLEPNSAETIQKIAGMVADFYGGPFFETGNTKSSSTDEKVTLLSQVKVGFCRPRALLFKYLADAVGLKSRLLMGLQLDSESSISLICSNPRKHLTNVVSLNEKELLVDVMRHPGHLRPFTVKALVMYHISGPGDSDSAEYDSCDSPLEPNSPLYGSQDRAESASPSQSEQDVAVPFSRTRRKTASEDRENKSSPELPSEVRYFQRRHMVGGARSFPSSPEHPQARFRSFRPITSHDGSNSSPETRARVPSILGGKRIPDEERASTSSPENSPQHQSTASSSFRRRSSSFCVRDGTFDKPTGNPSEGRSRARKRTTPEISDDVVRAVRAMKEVAKQGRRSEEARYGPNETAVEGLSSEPSSLTFCGSSSSSQSVISDAIRSSSRGSPGTTMSIADFLPSQPIMPFQEWNIDFSELRIGIRIGIGSFGEVFRATWRGTEVAVKRMLEQDLTRENTEDFFNEISLLSRLRHPNVILFMGACTTPPHLSMITEFMHMGSLYRLIHMSGQGKKLSWRRRLKMLRDICRGMMCVQRMNIIHRDLKSANCLVDKHWCVKVCDFGLSRLTDGSPIQEATAAGTPEWMAPELLRNEPVSYKCDIFSLGVIMWELCSLKRPWEGVQPLQVVHEVSKKNSRLEIPQGLLGKLISDCWEENPKDRPDYEEILTRLHECEFLLE